MCVYAYMCICVRVPSAASGIRGCLLETVAVLGDLCLSIVTTTTDLVDRMDYSTEENAMTAPMPARATAQSHNESQMKRLNPAHEQPSSTLDIAAGPYLGPLAQGWRTWTNLRREIVIILLLLLLLLLRPQRPP